MKVDILDQKGKKTTKKADLNDTVFGAEVNEKLLSQYVYVYLANQRQANAHTKDRSEVRGGGKKPWRQKGTGRARHGSSRSPIWTGGGVTFGPTNSRNYKGRLNRKAVKSAFRSAFSKLMSEKLIEVVDEVKVGDTKITKSAAEVVAVLKGDVKKVTLVTGKKDQSLVNGVNNLPGASVKMVSEISVYDILNGGKVVLLADSLDYINEKWAA